MALSDPFLSAFRPAHSNEVVDCTYKLHVDISYYLSLISQDFLMPSVMVSFGLAYRYGRHVVDMVLFLFPGSLLVDIGERNNLSLKPLLCRVS